MAVTSRILIGRMLSDACFDWLVGNMSMYQENLFQSRIFLHLFPSFVKLSLRNINFYKSNRGRFSVFSYM